jgi:drug/metabolite transporter (DMT)-like permease
MGTYLRFGLTTLLMLFIAGLSHNLSAFNQITFKQFLIFLTIVFSSGGLAMLLYYYGLKRVTASVSTICELAFPLSAIIFEFIIRGRMLTWSQWLGVLVLFFAIYQVSIVQKIQTN